MSMKAALKEIEAKMANLQAKVDAGRAAMRPHRAELDKLLEEQVALQAKIDAKVADTQAARGVSGEDWVALKRELGILAATRMQMRQALKSL